MTPEHRELCELIRSTRRWVMVVAWIVVIQAVFAVGYGIVAWSLGTR